MIDCIVAIYSKAHMYFSLILFAFYFLSDASIRRYPYKAQYNWTSTTIYQNEASLLTCKISRMSLTIFLSSVCVIH